MKIFDKKFDNFKNFLMFFKNCTNNPFQVRNNLKKYTIFYLVIFSITCFIELLEIEVYKNERLSSFLISIEKY